MISRSIYFHRVLTVVKDEFCTMKKLKLWVHSKEFDENEVVFNPKEFADISVGDLLEIYHPEEDKDSIPGQPRLLLQVHSSVLSIGWSKLFIRPPCSRSKI